MDKGHEATAAERQRSAKLDSIASSTSSSPPTAPASIASSTPEATSTTTTTTGSGLGASSAPTLAQAWSTIDFRDLLHVTQIPCARSSLLYGIGSGTALGLVKYVLNRRGVQALNWGAATFASVSLVTFEGCRFVRYQERMRMKYAVDRVEIKRREQHAQKEGDGQ